MRHTTDIISDLSRGDRVIISEGGMRRTVTVNSVSRKEKVFDYLDHTTNNTVAVRHYQIICVWDKAA